MNTAVRRNSFPGSIFRCIAGARAVLFSLALALMAGEVLANRTINSVTLNGGTSAVTVSPGASISATVNVTTDNNGSGSSRMRWRCTAWRIATSGPGSTTAVDHGNYDSAGTYSETFNITAPTPPGTYNAYFIAYQDNGCADGASGTSTLSNRVIVVLPPPSVVSIVRGSFNPTTSNQSVSWTVTFDYSVTGVNAPDFKLTQTGGAAGATITNVSGGGTTYTVTANTGSGTSGTVRLDLVDDDSIKGTTSLPLGGAGTGNGNFSGESYTILPPVCDGSADILFCDDFERSNPGSVGSGWTVNPVTPSNCNGTAGNTGCAGIDSDTPPFNVYANPRANPTRSMFTRWSPVRVVSPTVNLAGKTGAQLSFWMRRGHDSFSECPEAAGENYLVEYYASDSTWKTLAQYPSSPSAELCDGAIFTPAIELPSDAFHANFRLRFYQPSGSGAGINNAGAPGVAGTDYWHMDNIIIREKQAPSYVGAFCDNFEGGLARWSISAEGSASGAAIGDARLGTLTSLSPTHSLDTRWGAVSATTFRTDLTGVTGKITYWVRSGTNADRDPDNNENLVVEYLSNTGSWVNLATYNGSASAGTVFNGDHALPANAIHSNFRLRFRQTNGSGYDYDYWHIDDVCVGTIVPTADLAMNKQRNTLLTPGSNATYSLSVTNNGPDNVSGSLEVVDTLPAGLSYLSATGTGWTCSANGQVVTCGWSGTLNNGATTPAVTLTVAVAAGLTGTFTNTATVSGAVKDNVAANDTASDSFVIAPYCLDTYRFDGPNDSSPGADWRTSSSSGTFGQPRIFGNRLRLTNATTNVSTAAHLQKKFPAANNRIVVEFDYYAYSGTGADGIAVTLSDASVIPNAGAYGGSLGYAQKTGVNGFAGGWLGVGIDEYGNFCNDNEGRGDGTHKCEGLANLDDLRPDSVSVRGSADSAGPATGYRFHRESGALTPGVDQSVGHRYRITVDHSDSNNAYVQVERNSGGGYVTVIPRYNARAAGLGQAAVPDNWLLSFTGSTGDLTNVHEIDNLSICAAEPILSLGPDHYVISHSGTGLTCEAEPVIITAHDPSHGRADASGKVIAISTKTGVGTWSMGADNCSAACYKGTDTAVGCSGTFTATTGNNGQASYVFGTGETGVRLCLKHNTPGTVNIDVTDGSASETSGAVAGEAPPGADPSLVFSDAGFRFYADGSVDAIKDMIAGLNSATVHSTLQPTPQVIAIRALKASDATTAARCVSLLGSEDRTVKFAYQCVDPNTCHSASEGLKINGAAVAAGGVAGSDVTVPFNADGHGVINLTYWDVGKIKLLAQASVPDGLASGSKTIIVTGVSNSFVVKPYGFTVRACTASTPCTTDNDAATDGSGDIFARAGHPFKLTLRAVPYGNPGKITPSFGLGSNNESETILLAPVLAAPAGGSDGALDGTGTGTSCTPAPKAKCLYRSTFAGGVASIDDLEWSEVGVLNVAATNSAFLGLTVAASGTSGNIGRFIPDHFGVTGTLVTRSDLQLAELFPPTTGTIAAESKQLTVASVAGMEVGKMIRISGAGQGGADLLAKIESIDGLTRTLTLNVPAETGVANATVGNGDFTYMGEPMKLTLAVTAYSKAEGATQNYKGAFAKLDAGTLGTTTANWTGTSGGQRMGLAAVNNGNLTPRLSLDTTSPNSTNPANTTWSGGTSFFTLNLVFKRDGNPDGPYPNLKIGAKPLDADGVTLPPRLSTDTTHCVNLDIDGKEDATCGTAGSTFSNTESDLRRKLFETDVRFGRLWLGNAYGSDQRGLALPYETQFWNGFAFVRNADDNLAPFAVGNVSLVRNPAELATAAALGGFGGGNGTINLGAPGALGTVDVYVNLDSAGTPTNCSGHAEETTVARAYLSSRWCGANFDRDPAARATFGIQTGRRGPIYIRESY